ncbi:hypothetical protein P691DRAFT_770453 [Macrolepiota fuliginosa MF-IS2]|uniref:Mediator complex subunit 16 C-terminal domain-containing protein n=1 Tax=Macrolepiota fuliginosa MF-IS2 TaxID=1400762 RepID=A0A9P5XPI6_9AGAR|nr:hypothetical protein P691DRAFT_770453 [Macrolepiota fuliginosa MF-IS2]
MKPTSASPSKGKAKESTHWHSGWWDYYPLVERPHRPLQWSQSSVIFSAHPTQPAVIARHFSSSKQFTIPSPKPVSSNQTSYEPPTIISVAPTDDWLFAYFPKSNGDGTGCLWKRGAQIDNWVVQEWWTFPPETAPVTADWLGAPREWTINNSGKPDRLFPKGFILPTSSPTLILVTQDYRVHICYYQYYQPNLQILKCPLGVTNMLRVNQASVDDDPAELVKVCLDATICIGYNVDFPIFIAARVRQHTVTTAQNTPFDPMDLTVPVNTGKDDQKQDGWDSRNDECIVELNQVFLRYDGVVMAIFVQPTAPIPIPHSGLVRMDFLTCPINPTPSEIAGSASPTKKIMIDKGKAYLALSFLDFEGYASTPKSQLCLYAINRRSTATGKVTFGHQLEATRTFTPSILTYVASHAPHLKGHLLPVVVLDTSGQWSNTTPKKLKEIAAGKVYMLNLPDLKDKPDWEPSAIHVPLNIAGRNLPLQAVPSPNGVLIYTTSLSSPQPITGIHLLPQRSYAGVPPLVFPLVLAILGRKSPSDICHCLSLSAVSLNEVVKTLSGAMNILDANNNGLKYGSTWDVLGVAVEVYRKRASLAKDQLKERLTTKWHTAHDICSIAACNMVFGNCADGDTYDLDAVWRLTGLSNWIVALLERIMKECVMFCDVPLREDIEDSQDDLFGPTLDDASANWEISPTLLHLIHPFALQNLITALKHVKRYHQYLKSMSVSAEKSQIAQDLLVDMVDCSGLNLEGLETVLDASIQAVEALSPEDCRVALASCQPTLTLQNQLSTIVKTITDQPNTLNKAALFIKPGDLVGGVTNLSIGTQKKYRDEDVVTKGVVMTQEPHLTCSRCGGVSNVEFDLQSPEHVSDRWRIWEKMWALRCVCGGSWVGGNDYIQVTV